MTNVIPFDLDAARATQREVEQDPFVFTFHGRSYTVAPATSWPIEVSTYLMDGRLGEAMEMLLGEGDYKDFKTYAVLGDLQLIFAALAGHMGIDLPNSVSRQLLGSTPT